jgi:hypothetical protein
VAQQSNKSFFKAGKASSADTRAESVNSSVRAIVDAETRAREQKTARLKELRLQKEAEEKLSVEANPSKRPGKRKT